MVVLFFFFSITVIKHYNEDNLQKKVFNFDYSCMGLEHMMVEQRSLHFHSFILPLDLDHGFIKVCEYWIQDLVNRQAL